MRATSLLELRDNITFTPQLFDFYTRPIDFDDLYLFFEDVDFDMQSNRVVFTHCVNSCEQAEISIEFRAGATAEILLYQNSWCGRQRYEVDKLCIGYVLEVVRDCEMAMDVEFNLEFSDYAKAFMGTLFSE